MPLTASSQEASRRELPAIPVDTAPALDGEVRNDPVWQAVTPTGGFLQTKPDEGRPASQRTEVRVAYTEDAIYFGFVLYDDDPFRRSWFPTAAGTRTWRTRTRCCSSWTPTSTSRTASCSAPIPRARSTTGN